MFSDLQIYITCTIQSEFISEKIESAKKFLMALLLILWGLLKVKMNAEETFKRQTFSPHPIVPFLSDAHIFQMSLFIKRMSWLPAVSKFSHNLLFRMTGNEIHGQTSEGAYFTPCGLFITIRERGQKNRGKGRMLENDKER